MSVIDDNPFFIHLEKAKTSTVEYKVKRSWLSRGHSHIMCDTPTHDCVETVDEKLCE